MRSLSRLLAALHARGFHAAVLAGLVMMPAVVAAGFLTGAGRSDPPALAPSLGSLRGSIDEPPVATIAAGPHF